MGATLTVFYIIKHLIIMGGLCSKYCCDTKKTQTCYKKLKKVAAKARATKTKIEDICKCLLLSEENCKELCRLLLNELNRGLNKQTHPQSSVKCFPTYVRELPDGTENGKFLALDLGGTNFRVLLIELTGSDCEMKNRIYSIPQKIMLGSGEQLFDHIAECLAAFTVEHKITDITLPLGFTFSFPCSQQGLTKARLTTWTKGFKCAGVEGEDVVRLLRDSIARRGDVDIDVCAVVNDTTGTLMSCAWKNKNCYVGLIVGTGSNACYMEQLENVGLWDEDFNEPSQVIVNTEWGAFGDNGVLEHIRTKYDRNIDEASINPGRQYYEKMISGMYMGEIVRQVLIDLVAKGLLFNGEGSDILNEKGQFFTKYVSEIESDKEGDYTNCRQVLEELGIDNVTDAECNNVRYVCECVSRRAADLTSSGVACLLNKIGKKHVTVAVDGSVYRYHPFFHDLMTERIKNLLNPELEFNLILSQDGSGRGAALVAAVACRLRS